MNALAFGLALRAPGAAPRVTRRPRRQRVAAIASSPNGMSVADLAEPCLPSHGRSPTELAQIGAANNNKKGANSKADSANAKKGGKKAVVSKGSQPFADPGLYDVMLSGATFTLIVSGGLFAFPEMAKAIGILPSDESVWSRGPAQPQPSSRNDRLYVPYADVKAEMAAAAAAAEAHWSTRPKPPGSGLSKTHPPEPTPELEPTPEPETDTEKEPETEPETVVAAAVVSPSSADVQPAGAIATSTSSDVNSALGDLISSPLFYVTFGVAAAVALVRLLERSGVENAEFGLSALPIVLLTAISKTEFGAGLAKNIEDRRPALEAERARVERERAAARATMPAHYGPSRRRFLPEAFGYAFPAHLDGTLCGDVGFDPLGLAKEKGALDRYRELELLHGRWAMLGVVGAAVPEALARFGGFELGEPVWWKVGEAKLNSPDLALDYLGFGGFHIAGSSGLAVIAACQLFLMGGPEYARFVGVDSLVPVGVYLPGDRDYPGGAPFDPFGVSADARVFERQKVAEMKHGRLAMVAMLGCFAQAWATGVGPVENLTETWEKLLAFL